MSDPAAEAPSYEPSIPESTRDVQEWSQSTSDSTFTDSAISTVLSLVPAYEILSQSTAEILHAALTPQAKMEPDRAEQIILDAFAKWAWNINAKGGLKDEPYLTLKESEVWMGYREPGQIDMFKDWPLQMRFS
jgi:hypothetical protein